MNRFVFEKYFHKSINISLCDKYFYKNKKLKLNFGGHVAIQNNFFSKTSLFSSMEGVWITAVAKGTRAIRQRDMKTFTFDF